MSELSGVEHEVVVPRKVLRIPPHFGQPKPSDVFGLEDTEHEKKTIDLFRSRGFAIEHGGAFVKDNPYEVGIGTDHGTPILERDKAIAEQAGIPMPDTYEAKSLLEDTRGRKIVAKRPEAQRGEEKYLLESDITKERFLTWALLAGHNTDSFIRLLSNPNPMDTINDLYAKVRRGDFTDQYFAPDFISGWQFEEYIETPGIYNTSLRVVADAFGNVHYGQVARSEQSRPGEAQIPTEGLIDISKLPKDFITLWGKPLDVYLRDKHSPFFIDPQQFVSNIMAGGRPLLLNGEPIVDPVDRRIIADLDIDPDNPTIPASLLGISSRIGKLSRGIYPFVGIDYLKTKDPRGFVFLEDNAEPNLRPEGLGLPPDTNEYECNLALMGKVIDGIPKV